MIISKKTLNCSIWHIDETLTGTPIMGQTGLENNGYKGVPHILKSSYPVSHYYSCYFWPHKELPICNVVLYWYNLVNIYLMTFGRNGKCTGLCPRSKRYDVYFQTNTLHVWTSLSSSSYWLKSSTTVPIKGLCWHSFIKVDNYCHKWLLGYTDISLTEPVN